MFLAVTSNNRAGGDANVVEVFSKCDLSLSDGDEVDGNVFTPDLVCHRGTSGPHFDMQVLIPVDLAPSSDLRTKHGVVLNIVSGLERVDPPPGLERVTPGILSILVAKSTVHIVVVAWSHNVFVVWIDSFELIDVF